MTTPADTLLLIAPGCPHCSTVLAALSDMVKKGEIGRLDIVNIAIHPETAQAHGARSAPWIKIGHFELSGNYTPGELAEWAAKAASGGGHAAYLRELLEQQQLDTALSKFRENPELVKALIRLLQSEDTPISVRFGLSAIIEELAPEGLLAPYISEIGSLTHSETPSIRADAAHFLGLTGHVDAASYIEELLNDPIDDVREIAKESLSLLKQ